VIKAYSVYQPWAQLIVNGIKTCDARHFHVDYLGPVAIHAPSKTEYVPYNAICTSAPMHYHLINLGYLRIDRERRIRWVTHPPRMAIVGVVDLTEIHMVTDELIEGMDPMQRSLCWRLAPGLNLMVFENPRVLDEPIPYSYESTGRPRLKDFDERLLPAGIL